MLKLFIYISVRHLIVDIGILCHKLRDLGIHGKLGKWIHNFLSEREQYIVIN